MTIAKKVDDFMADSGIEFDLVSHERTESSSRTASAAHVKGEHLAKSVVLHDGERYVLGVVPSTHRIELDTLGEMLKRRLTLASEAEIARLFEDCAIGADPPLGGAYGLSVVVDDALMEKDDVYFEGGDHETLVHVTASGFERLMRNAERGRFSHHV